MLSFVPLRCLTSLKLHYFVGFSHQDTGVTSGFPLPRCGATRCRNWKWFVHFEWEAAFMWIFPEFKTWKKLLYPLMGAAIQHNYIQSLQISVSGSPQGWDQVRQQGGTNLAMWFLALRGCSNLHSGPQRNVLSFFFIFTLNSSMRLFFISTSCTEGRFQTFTDKCRWIKNTQKNYTPIKLKNASGIRHNRTQHDQAASLELVQLIES